MNTTDRECEQREEDAWDADACAVAHTVHPLWRLACYQRKLGNFECWYVARGDSLAENRAM